MNNTTTKRAYHHTEAWLAKHAAKFEAKKSDVVSKKPPKKNNKNAATVEKKLKKHRKQAAKKVAKKSAMKKAKVEKTVNNKSKITMKSAVKLFNSVKKQISATKKATKQIGKFFTEAIKIGDQKYFERVQKLFSRIGYVYVPENDFVTFENKAKVKRQKAKKQKIKETKKTAMKTSEAKKVAEETLTKPMKPATSTTKSIPIINAIQPPELEDDELDANEDEEDEDEIVDVEMEAEIEGQRDDEDDEEFNARVNEERNIIRERAEDAVATREEIFAAMEENGDFS